MDTDTNKRPRNSLYMGKGKQKDWISLMPDEILIMILSRLPWKEAVRTSVLSHNWKNLWKYYSGIMEFDATETMKIAMDDRHKLYIGACKTRDLVNQILLNSDKSTSLQGLKVAAGLDMSSTNSIDRWIDFARVKKVERLELDLSIPSRHHPDDYHKYMYTFPDWLLGLPPTLDVSTSICFETLTTLSLKCVNVSEEVLVTHFLSYKNCPLLQKLCLDDIPTIRRLRVAGPRLKLKHLEIKNCFQLVDLKVSAPELIVFKYEGSDLKDMPLEDVPRLSSLTLGGEYIHSIIPTGVNLLSTYISQIQRLELNIFSYMVMMDDLLEVRAKYDYKYHPFPKFSNLKQLEVTFTTNNGFFHNMILMSLLVHVSPQLREFTVKYSTEYTNLKEESLSCLEMYGNDHGKPKLTKRSHENLKVVKFNGWVGLESEFELAMHLSQIGVSIEKMIIDTHNPFDDENPSIHRNKEAARKRAKQLSTILPPGADLIIL